MCDSPILKYWRYFDRRAALIFTYIDRILVRVAEGKENSFKGYVDKLGAYRRLVRGQQACIPSGRLLKLEYFQGPSSAYSFWQESK